MDDMPKSERIFTCNSPVTLRIDAYLAQEIGFTESVVLLQIEFLISISDKIHEGRIWTYDSTRGMKKKYFPWWSVATINRAIKRLEDMGLIVVGNFNKYKYDQTRWFALDYHGLRELRSIQIAPQPEIGGDDTRSAQNETGSAQNETTIPEITTEITSKNTIRDSQKNPVSVPVPGISDSDIAEVVSHFEKETGIARPPLARRGSRPYNAQRAAWECPARELLQQVEGSVEEARNCVSRAKQRMRDKGWSISSPRSMKKTAVAIAAERAEIRAQLQGRSINALDPARIEQGL